jgi:lysophospholipase L1-like esterase
MHDLSSIVLGGTTYIMKLSSRSARLALALFVLPAGPLFAEHHPPGDLSTLVVVGDSLSAGVQNFSLLDTQQPNGYVSLIASQAKVPLTLPLIPFPGAPNVLQLTSLYPLTIAPMSGNLPPIPRDNPCTQPTNLAVPGVTVEQALTLVPAPPSAIDGTPQLSTDLVLGFPNPLASLACTGKQGPSLTQIQQAVALHPTTVIDYLGNNDALVPALTGTLNTLTPLSSFANSYDQVLDALEKTHATIITATIPDVTKVPYFTSVSTIAAELHLPAGIVAAKLGVGPHDLLRPTAGPIALSILSNQTQGPLPQVCPLPLPGLPGTDVPCVLTAKDAELVRLTIDAYNVVILFESITHGATLVDIHAAVDGIAGNGVDADNKHLTTAFLGGLFSLDGVHPTNTGYAVIANAFIERMNASLGSGIPFVNLNAIAASDPLVPPVKVPYTP